MNIVVFYYVFYYNIDGFCVFCSNLYNNKCLIFQIFNRLL